MPGCGKSTIGKCLAQMLDCAFYDSDNEIERAAGKKIPRIFTEDGEQAFRQLELETLTALCEKRPPAVLATGGGAFVQAQTRAALLERAVTVWLKPPRDVLLERVSRKNTRPLLENGDKEELLDELIAARYPFYAEAHITLETKNAPKRVTASALLDALRGYCDAR